ncbi:Trp biosynthesis-associated membrane protein [Tessaracoccus sp. SD287]|uniref:Trp biosynthesis-associated membrane protein n=1 Tax=Tessaracoccus sp. SD287 TaxID=2782008 RepID=UPI001A966E6E|nr:Trp biosynthesis-associated membrane protein [Tessaracoccus sp. SD287]
MSRLRWYGPLLAALGGISCGAFGDNPIGWAIVAGAVVLFVLGNGGKRILGVLIVLVSLLAGWLTLDLSPLNPLGVLGAVLGLVGGVLIVATAGAWPSSRSRFEPGGRAVSADAPPLEVWKAMDEGHDPTEEPGAPQLESDEGTGQAR